MEVAVAVAVGVALGITVGVGLGVGGTPVMVMRPFSCGGTWVLRSKSMKRKLLGSAAQVSGVLVPDYCSP